MSQTGMEDNLYTADQFIEIFGSVIADALKKLDQLTPAKKTQKWIPVSDRLPDKDFINFLVQIGHGEFAVYETAYRVRGRWVFYSDRIDGEGQSVIAWMECPEPYTEEEQ